VKYVPYQAEAAVFDAIDARYPSSSRRAHAMIGNSIRLRDRHDPTQSRRPAVRVGRL